MRRRAGDLFFAPWWNTSSRSLSYFSIWRRCWFSRISRRFSSTRISSSPKSVSPFFPFVKILPRMDISFLQRTQHPGGELRGPVALGLADLALGRVQETAVLCVDQPDADPEPARRRRVRPDVGIPRTPVFLREDAALRREQRDQERGLGPGVARREGRPRRSVRVGPHDESLKPDLVQPPHERLADLVGGPGAFEPALNVEHGDPEAVGGVKIRGELDPVGLRRAAGRRERQESQDGPRRSHHSSNMISGGSFSRTGASAFFSFSFSLTGRISSFFSGSFSRIGSS